MRTKAEDIRERRGKMSTASKPQKDTPVKPADVRPPDFADQTAKLAWETKQAVNQCIGNLPPEAGSLNARPIRFSKEYDTQGTFAVFFAGTVIGTDEKGVFVVPQRTIQILEQLGIPYQEAA